MCIDDNFTQLLLFMARDFYYAIEKNMKEYEFPR